MGVHLVLFCLRCLDSLRWQLVSHGVLGRHVPQGEREDILARRCRLTHCGRCLVEKAVEKTTGPILVEGLEPDGLASAVQQRDVHIEF